MHQTLSMQKRFHEKPDVDQCSLEDEHQWHKHQCLLVHKTLQVVKKNDFYNYIVQLQIVRGFISLFFRLWIEIGRLEVDSSRLNWLMLP